MDCQGALGVPTVADGHQPNSAGGCAVESDQTQACARGHIIEPFTHHETVVHLAAAAQNRPISLHPPLGILTPLGLEILRQVPMV